MTVPDAQGQEVPTDPSGLAVEPAGTGTQAPADNPVYWNELQTLPESVRPLVEPIFKEWDSNVGKRLQSVHSEYEPYKSLVDEWEPDALQQAISLAQALEENPQEFVQQLIQAYGIDLGQGAASQSQTGPQGVLQPEVDTDLIDPNILALQQQQAQYEQLLQTMAETMISERNSKAENDAQQQLDVILADLKTQHGDFDENYVLSLISQNVDPAAAVGMFQQAVGAYAAKVNAPALSAPQVVGSGGGYPSNQVDPASLDDKATKDLVVQMLRAANQNG